MLESMAAGLGRLEKIVTGSDRCRSALIIGLEDILVRNAFTRDAGLVRQLGAVTAQPGISPMRSCISSGERSSM
jgi:hypothetical protein